MVTRDPAFLMTLTGTLLTFTFSFHPLDASSLIIQQSPVNLLANPKQKEARLDCYHGDNNYPYMLWYRFKSTAGGQRSMEQIGALHYEKPNFEKNFETRFNITGHSKSKAQLVISDLTQTDSAVYFCAARKHSVSTLVAPLQKAGSLQTSTCIKPKV